MDVKNCKKDGRKIFALAITLQTNAFAVVFNKRRERGEKKEGKLIIPGQKLPSFGKRNNRGFGSIIVDTHHPTLISFHRETIYNVPLGTRITRTTLEKSLIGSDWGSRDLPVFER